MIYIKILNSEMSQKKSDHDVKKSNISNIYKAKNKLLTNLYTSEMRILNNRSSWI